MIRLALGAVIGFLWTDISSQSKGSQAILDLAWIFPTVSSAINLRLYLRKYFIGSWEV